MRSTDNLTGEVTAKLLDFGLSKNAGAGSSAKTFVGTPCYLGDQYWYLMLHSFLFVAVLIDICYCFLHTKLNRYLLYWLLYMYVHNIVLANFARKHDNTHWVSVQKDGLSSFHHLSHRTYSCITWKQTLLLFFYFIYSIIGSIYW